MFGTGRAAETSGPRAQVRKCKRLVLSLPAPVSTIGMSHRAALPALTWSSARLIHTWSGFDTGGTLHLSLLAIGLAKQPPCNRGPTLVTGGGAVSMKRRDWALAADPELGDGTEKLEYRYSAPGPAVSRLHRSHCL